LHGENPVDDLKNAKSGSGVRSSCNLFLVLVVTSASVTVQLKGVL